MFKKTINLFVSILVLNFAMAADIQLTLTDTGVEYTSSAANWEYAPLVP